MPCVTLLTHNVVATTSALPWHDYSRFVSSATHINIVVVVCWLHNVPANANLSAGQVCSDNGTCCHTQTEAADQTCYLTLSQYVDTKPASLNVDPMMPGAWKGGY